MKLLHPAPWIATIALASAASYHHGVSATPEDAQAPSAPLEQEARNALRTITNLLASEVGAGHHPVTEAPFASSTLDFDIRRFGDPEARMRTRIGAKGGRLAWVFEPDTPGSHGILIAEGVAPFLEGETPNGMDDNGNGLIDERGMSFTFDRRALTVRLTLEREGEEGVEQRTVETTLTFRNPTRASGF